MSGYGRPVKVLAAHQPDFLPWAGFFAKMAQADVFDLAVYDQFKTGNYHHRVTLSDGAWLTLPVDAPFGCTFEEVTLKPNWNRKVIERIRHVYARYPFFRERFGPFLSVLQDPCYRRMADLNIDLIVTCKQALGIKAALHIAEPPQGADTTERLVHMLDYYQPGVYLSGEKGRDYLDLSRVPYPVRFNDFASPSPHSVIGIIFGKENPGEYLGFSTTRNLAAAAT